MLEEFLKVLLGSSLKDHPITGLAVLIVVGVSWLVFSAFASPIKRAVQANFPDNPTFLCRQAMTAVLILHIAISYLAAFWSWYFTDLPALETHSAAAHARAVSYFATASIALIPLSAYVFFAQIAGLWPIAAFSVLASWLFVAAVAIGNPETIPSEVGSVSAFAWLYCATNLNTQVFMLAMIVACLLGKGVWKLAGSIEHQLRNREK
ncbi:MAG: hypothetical protein ACRCS9_06120 [Hyphomicrobium sp.]